MFLKIIGFAIVLACFIALVVWGLIIFAKEQRRKDERITIGKRNKGD